MVETKKYLEMSIKRKNTIKRSLKDIEPSSPAGQKEIRETDG